MGFPYYILKYNYMFVSFNFVFLDLLNIHQYQEAQEDPHVQDHILVQGHLHIHDMHQGQDLALEFQAGNVTNHKLNCFNISAY